MTDAPATTKRDFWVSLPRLDESERASYKPASDIEMEADSEEDESPLEIVNEIRLGTDLYYWIKGKNGIIYRVSGALGHPFSI